MDNSKDFQDRVDDYLLGRMNDADKEAFLHEVAQDEDKKEQLEFTRSMKEAIDNRAEAEEALEQCRRRYDAEHGSTASLNDGMAKDDRRLRRKRWLWTASVAAVLCIGFFSIKPLIHIPTETERGGEEIFDDTTNVDTVQHVTVEIKKQGGGR